MAIVCRQTNEKNDKKRTTRSDNGKNNKTNKLFLVIITADNAHTDTQTGTNTENNEPISLIIIDPTKVISWPMIIFPKRRK